MKVYYVDVDGTICRCKSYGIDTDYSKAVPMKDRIRYINSLYDEGHTVVYYTARGQLSKRNWQAATEEQLEKWGARYTELRLDKPFFDFIIDDRAINSEDFFLASLK